MIRNRFYNIRYLFELFISYLTPKSKYINWNDVKKELNLIKGNKNDIAKNF